jgi:protein-tyrosine phosphatase
VIDLHCHILPGLDDGPGSFEESLAMARMAVADGTTVIVATPHVDENLCYPQPERIRELVGRLNELIVAEGLGLRVLPGAEVRAAPELVERLVAGKVMTVADQGKYVLVELPTSGQAVFAGELFFRLQVAGYVPIIAHAERVDWFRREPRVLEEFRARGVRLQINAESVAGKAGRGLRNTAVGLVKSGLADVLASDGHNVSSRKPLLSVGQRNLRGLNGAFERLTVTTPGCFLANGVVGERVQEG